MDWYLGSPSPSSPPMSPCSRLRSAYNIVRSDGEPSSVVVWVDVWCVCLGMVEWEEGVDDMSEGFRAGRHPALVMLAF